MGAREPLLSTGGVGRLLRGMPVLTLRYGGAMTSPHNESQRSSSQSASMEEADVANGESPQPPSRGSGHDDPDAPGLSALDDHDGDAIEPNEPG